MSELYGILRNMYGDYSVERLEAEFNRIEFLAEYTIAGKRYTKKEVKKAFEKLINEK